MCWSRASTTGATVFAARCGCVNFAIVSGDASKVPDRVELDTGCRGLVHKDEHWLIRDLSLQAPGPRQSAKESCLKRIERRHRGDYTFEAVDHATRRVRACPPPDSDEEHGEDCDCGC